MCLNHCEWNVFNIHDVLDASILGPSPQYVYALFIYGDKHKHNMIETYSCHQVFMERYKCIVNIPARELGGQPSTSSRQIAKIDNGSIYMLLIF